MKFNYNKVSKKLKYDSKNRLFYNFNFYFKILDI